MKKKGGKKNGGKKMEVIPTLLGERTLLSTSETVFQPN
jgi:hypothetical protein